MTDSTNDTDQGVDATRRARGARRLALTLFAVTIGMFGFGYALVPLYDLLCDITGLNGTTGVVVASDLPGGGATAVDESRLIKVQFLTTVNGTLPWEFRAQQTEMEVHPGKIYEARFVAVNRSDEAIVGQAVPSVAPIAGARYFNKTECFCFTQQTLQPGETKEMPVRFVIDPRLDQRVGTVTLSYTFFRSPNAA